MNRMVLIDLDGVCADSSARFAKAEEAKQSVYLEHENDDDPTHQAQIRQWATDAYWRVAFMPSLVALDTLIDGVLEALEQIEKAGYNLYFITSRPESMREATTNWLFEHGLIFVRRIHSELIMKPDSQKFVKTVVWKSGVVEVLVRLLGVDDLLFVDDEESTQEAIAALDLPCDRKIGGSLQEAVAMLVE